MHPERSDVDGSGRRREPTDLYATVLEVVKRHSGGARITRVSYGAGMPVDRLRILVDRLMAAGLLASQEFEGHLVYDVTARGQEFLDTYWKLRGFIEGVDRAPDERRPAVGRAVDPGARRRPPA